MRLRAWVDHVVRSRHAYRAASEWSWKAHAAASKSYTTKAHHGNASTLKSRATARPHEAHTQHYRQGNQSANSHLDHEPAARAKRPICPRRDNIHVHPAARECANSPSADTERIHAEP